MITETQIIDALKTVYDPEIPVNIYDLGLIYSVQISGDVVQLVMTLTTATCPAAAFIPELVQTAVRSVPGVQDVQVHVTYEPRWNKSMMSGEARRILGYAL